MDDVFMTNSEEIGAVMAQVVDQTRRIVEHLRIHGEKDAANNIARDVLSMMGTFQQTVASWKADMTLMQPRDASASNNGVAVTTANVEAPSSGQISTWAKVAATAPAIDCTAIAQNPKHRQIMHPAPSHTRPPAPTNGVVWIRGWGASRPLGDASKEIGQGPIFSMTYCAEHDALCIIFQHAISAVALHDDDRDYFRQNGVSKFGAGCRLVVGDPYPQNNDIRRMEHPHNERRRLTFARQQLFSNGMTEDRFKADIYGIVGEANVDLVWLFNTGNATVVFAAVPLACLVRRKFGEYAKQSDSPYHGTIVSFSHDPCEKSMKLVTQIPAAGDSRNQTTYGGESCVSGSFLTRNGAIGGRRNNRGIDFNGWQTVARRR